MASSIEQITQQALAILIHYGLNILGAIVILIIGRIVARDGGMDHRATSGIFPQQTCINF